METNQPNGFQVLYLQKDHLEIKVRQENPTSGKHLAEDGFDPSTSRLLVLQVSVAARTAAPSKTLIWQTSRKNYSLVQIRFRLFGC